MAREKFKTLTEQMFYILLCLRQECCGADIMAEVSRLTGGRVSVGPGTLYNLLESFWKPAGLPAPRWRDANAAISSLPPVGKHWKMNTIVSRN